MFYFSWSGFKKDGQRLKGIITAPDLPSAKQKLIDNKIIVQKIQQKTFMLFNINWLSNIKTSIITAFTRSLLSLITTDIPLSRALELLANTQKNKNMQIVIKNIRNHITSGMSLTDAFGSHPQQFNTIFCAFINIGEKTGNLDKMLQHLLCHREKEELLDRKIKQAMTYPAIVMTVSCIVMSILCFFVVPQFAEIFKNMHATMPAITLFIIQGSHFLQTNFISILASCTILLLAIFYTYKQNKNLQTIICKYLLMLPLVGKLLNNSILAKITRTLAITYNANMTLYDGLKLAASVTKNPIHIKAIHAVLEELATGQCLYYAFSKTKIYSPHLLEMISLGEESGTMGTVLTKLADYYEAEIDIAVTNLSIWIEPVMIILLSLGIGGFIIAMYLPIFNLGAIM